MKVYMEGAIAHLKGDFTKSGVTNGGIDSLVDSLHQIELGGENNVRINCGKIRAADVFGLQLLYVWMQCARFIGAEPELFNLPDSMQKAVRMMRLEHCFPLAFPMRNSRI